MKLEELLAKGSSSPPEDDDEDEKVDLKPQKSSSATADEGAENAEDAAEDAGEKEGAGGKKKGTRKKRSLNWEEAERGLLLEVIKSKVAFVENRSVDAKSIKAKRLAWSQITKQFNALNFRHRLLEQIQVQWRSMKNSAKREHQQKHPKAEALEGMRMIEFMEEMQKDPVTSRSQTRSANTNGAIKKELLDIDEDEDMPLAALPNSTNASEDTLQTSTIAIPSPPPSTAGGDADSQQESTPAAQQPAQRRKRAKAKPSPLAGAKAETSAETGEENEKTAAASPRKRRQRNLSQAQSVLSDENEASNSVAPITTLQQFSLGATQVAADTNSQPVDLVSTSEMEQKYKQDLFKLLKQARLAEIDYARREHEQKLRFEQMEQEIKMAYYRQEQDLKLRHMREEHDIRLRQQRREHEARLSIYSLKSSGLNGSIQEPSAAKCNAKADYNNVHDVAGPSTSAEGALALNAACN
ncbi:transcriptional regulator ATRX homolog [Drosophila kikkawai]|uniref:Regulatory protein zeste n=1 Tax=Drosophila kikkawai TaxID=30033 RepID=A0A6P4I981_DROKI|nr:uncharacterized protein LOC108076394 [Drosophila kikkawai]